MHRKRGQSNKGQRPCQLHVAEPGLELVLFLSIYVLKLILLSIADLQCCVHFRCIVKWINYTLHISSFLEVLSLYRSLQSTFFFNWSIVDWFTVLCQSLLYSKVTPLYMRIHYFHIHFHYSLSRSMEYSSLCYTKAPCCLSVQNAMVCIDRHWPSPAHAPTPLAWQPQVCPVCPWVCLRFLDGSICAVFQTAHISGTVRCPSPSGRLLSTVISSCTYVLLDPVLPTLLSIPHYLPLHCRIRAPGQHHAVVETAWSEEPDMPTLA